MKLDSLRALYLHELNDLNDAEKQLAQALPKLAKAASSADLRQAFETHADHTAKHLRRLDKAFVSIDEEPKRSACKAMKGILAEAEEMIEAEGAPVFKDAGLIASAQRIEHYEMAAYATAHRYAELLGEKDAAELLEKTLKDERATNKDLGELAKQVLADEAVHA